MNDAPSVSCSSISMKQSLQRLFILLSITASSQAFSQTTIVDQANEVYYPPSTWNIEYFHPMGQEFNPALTSLNFVDLMLMDFYGHGYVTGELAVSIHADTIAGPLLGPGPFPLPMATPRCGNGDGRSGLRTKRAIGNGRKTKPTWPTCAAFRAPFCRLRISCRSREYLLATMKTVFV